MCLSCFHCNQCCILRDILQGISYLTFSLTTCTDRTSIQCRSLYTLQNIDWLKLNDRKHKRGNFNMHACPSWAPHFHKAFQSKIHAKCQSCCCTKCWKVEPICALRKILANESKNHQNVVAVEMKIVDLSCGWRRCLIKQETCLVPRTGRRVKTSYAKIFADQFIKQVSDKIIIVSTRGECFGNIAQCGVQNNDPRLERTV